MWKAYNIICPSEINDGEELKDVSVYEKFNNVLRPLFYDGINNVIDGGKLSDSWFSELDCQVFISHSHADQKIANHIANLFFDRGINAFVDSNSWGYCLDLLKQMDDEFCLDSRRDNYLYEKRNITTSYVYMMLSMALNSMIDKCECFLFLNSSNSIPGVIDAIAHTHSPWIAGELLFAGKVGKRKPDRMLTEGLSKSAAANESMMPILRIPVDLEFMKEVEYSDLINSLEFYKFQISRGLRGKDILREIAKEVVDKECLGGDFMDKIYREL